MLKYQILDIPHQGWVIMTAPVSICQNLTPGMLRRFRHGIIHFHLMEQHVPIRIHLVCYVCGRCFRKNDPKIILIWNQCPKAKEGVVLAGWGT